MKQPHETPFQEDHVLRLICRLALPTVAGQIILVIYNIADTFFVSLSASDAKISAVTVCLPAFMLLSAISNLFGIGASSAIGRAMGRGKIRRARRTAGYAFRGCLIATLIYSLLALIFLHPYVTLLGGIDPEAHRYAALYLFVTVALGGIGASMSALMSHLFRAEGRSFLSAIGVSLGGLLNIALDPLFMFVILPPGNEVLGAAIATTLSGYCSLLYFMILLRRSNKKKTVLRLSFSAKSIKKAYKKRIPADVIGAGLPACLMTLFENTSYAVLGNLLARHSLEAHAGVGVAKKINMLAHCIVRGTAQGVLPYIAFQYAAGDSDRLKKSIRLSMLLSVGTASACMVLCLLFADPLIGLFIRHASPSHAFGVIFLRILCVGAPFSACAYLLISFFQATGNGLRSFFLAMLRKGALDIPLMFLFSAVGGVTMIVMATPIADAVCCMSAIIMFVSFMRSKEVFT